MKTRRLLSMSLVILCAAILFGCGGKAKINIEAGTNYYVKELDSFPFIMEKADDNSCLVFGADFKSMTIWFDDDDADPADPNEIYFAITSCSRKNGQIKGTASRIQTASEPNEGTIVRYSFWSDDELIYLKTLVSYKIFTAENPTVPETVSNDTIVARFLRTAPPYIA